jgi:hypothetical protein
MEDRDRNSALRLGVVLIILGGLFLLVRAAPDLFGWVGDSSWPLIIVGVGIVLLLIGAVTGAAGMAVPAAIVGGIGGLLYWQNATGNWQSWAYAWTLIPGFVGAGTLVAGLWRQGPDREGRPLAHRNQPDPVRHSTRSWRPSSVRHPPRLLGPPYSSCSGCSCWSALYRPAVRLRVDPISDSVYRDPVSGVRGA